MRIRFTARQVYETGGPGLGPVFEPGEVVDLRDDLARRWLRRGVAVEVGDAAAAADVAADQAPAPAVAPGRPATSTRKRRRDAR